MVIVLEFVGRPSVLSSETNPTTERRAASSSGYCSTVPMIFLWYRRVPSSLVSDQRNCQTSGPSLRLFRCIHPVSIFSSGTAVAEQKNLQAWRRMEGQEGAISRVNCFAAAVLRHDLNLYDFPSPWRDRPPWLVVLGVRQIPGLAATDCLLCGSQEALDDLRQHRLDRERVVSGVRHDCELVCGPQ